MTGEDRLPLVVRFELRGGIELEGAAEALLRLAAVLRGGDARTTYQLTVPAHGQAGPYDGFLAHLRLDVTAGRIRIHRDGETLRIEGSSEAFEMLAHNVEFLVSSTAEAGSNDEDHPHVHVEYYDDHPFLSQEAEPLTIILA